MTVASTASVLSAYFVAYALVLLPGGALVDRYGARRLALIGLAVFAVGAGAGAVVNDFGLLVAHAGRSRAWAPGWSAPPRWPRR